MQSCRWKSEARNGEGGLNYDQLVVNKQQQIQTYLKCLLDKNKVMNLTGRALPEMSETVRFGGFLVLKGVMTPDLVFQLLTP